jgi:hypothetical protein
MEKRIKITALFSEVSHGLVYQRLRIPFRKLDPSKFEYQITTFDDQFVHYDNRTDIFVFIHPSMKEELDLIDGLKKAGKRVIVDIDDLLTELPSSHPESDMLLHCRDMVPEILMRANWVTTSTESLTGYYGHLNKHFSVIENALDTELVPANYTPIKKPYKTGFTVGWCGGKTHIEDQYEFVFGLERFLIDYPNAKAHFKGLMPHRLQKRFGVRTLFDPRMVHYLEYHQWLGTVPWDVCLVGLTDSNFNHAKSDLRFIECARHHIPIIASPMADFQKHIEAGLCLGADSNEKFHNMLAYMIENPAQCKEMADKAHDYAMSYRLDVHAAAKWEATLLAVMET